MQILACCRLRVTHGHSLFGTSLPYKEVSSTPGFSSEERTYQCAVPIGLLAEGLSKPKVIAQSHVCTLNGTIASSCDRI